MGIDHEAKETAKKNAITKEVDAAVKDEVKKVLAIEESKKVAEGSDEKIKETDRNAKFKAQLDALEKRVDDHPEKLDAINNKLDSMDKKRNTLDHEIQDISNNLESLGKEAEGKEA